MDADPLRPARPCEGVVPGETKQETPDDGYETSNSGERAANAGPELGQYEAPHQQYYGYNAYPYLPPYPKPRDPYSFVEEELPHHNHHQHQHPPLVDVHAMPQPKKRGRKKKIKDENGLEIKVEGGLETVPRPVKERKKHDRFNGMSEEEVSRRLLPDHLAENLDIIIIGINPGLFAAYKGHHYAGPGNHFWKCLYLSGLTREQMSADEDFKLLNFGIGFTNMVPRATKGSADLTRREIKDGSAELLRKLQEYRPKVAVFNGKLIYEVFSGKKDFCFGKQPEPVAGTNTYIWVMPSSSARCAQLPRAADKVPYYAALRKFRDFLNGLVPHIDESELVFPDNTARRPQDEQEIRRLTCEPEPGETLVLEDGTEVPLKKKRGRPKKVRGEGEPPVVPRPRAPKAPLLSGPTQGPGPGLDLGKKKRGRPKKIRPEEQQFLLQQQQAQAQQQQAQQQQQAAMMQQLPPMQGMPQHDSPYMHQSNSGDGAEPGSHGEDFPPDPSLYPPLTQTADYYPPHSLDNIGGGGAVGGSGGYYSPRYGSPYSPRTPHTPSNPPLHNNTLSNNNNNSQFESSPTSGGGGFYSPSPAPTPYSGGGSPAFAPLPAPSPLPLDFDPPAPSDHAPLTPAYDSPSHSTHVSHSSHPSHPSQHTPSQNSQHYEEEYHDQHHYQDNANNAVSSSPRLEQMHQHPQIYSNNYARSTPEAGSPYSPHQSFRPPDLQPNPPGSPHEPAPKPVDVSSKSLSGLESLVDQIPSIAESPAPEQPPLELLYPPYSYPPSYPPYAAPLVPYSPSWGQVVRPTASYLEWGGVGYGYGAMGAMGAIGGVGAVGGVPPYYNYYQPPAPQQYLPPAPLLDLHSNKDHPSSVSFGSYC